MLQHRVKKIKSGYRGRKENDCRELTSLHYARDLIISRYKGENVIKSKQLHFCSIALRKHLIHYERGQDGMWCFKPGDYWTYILKGRWKYIKRNKLCVEEWKTCTRIISSWCTYREMKINVGEFQIENVNVERSISIKLNFIRVFRTLSFNEMPGNRLRNWKKVEWLSQAMLTLSFNKVFHIRSKDSNRKKVKGLHYSFRGSITDF